MLLDSCRELGDGKVTGKSYPGVMADILGYKVGAHIIFCQKTNGSKIETARILHSRMDLNSRMQR